MTRAMKTQSSVTFGEVIDMLSEDILSALANQGKPVADAIADMENSELILPAAGTAEDTFDDYHVDDQIIPISETNILPPDLVQFLHDSFDNYDVDDSGRLDVDEFWALMQSTALPLEDRETMFQKWDGISIDGKIDWVEVIQNIEPILAEISKDGQDHWVCLHLSGLIFVLTRVSHIYNLECNNQIGLTDRQSGYLFWYNLRDNATQWMSDEDQMTYRAHRCAIESVADHHREFRSNWHLPKLLLNWAQS